jgi:S1-C subfamily serine protease
VDEKSPAKKARFREGDRIVSWNGTPVPDTHAWNDVVSKAKSGDKADVVVNRDGKATKLVLVLGST